MVWDLCSAAVFHNKHFFLTLKMTSFDISVSLLIEKQIKFQNDTFNSVYLYKQWKSDSTAIANC